MRRPPYLPQSSEPFVAINTTPMIDVMLVLLIMMIMTLPKPTHQVSVELPANSTGAGVPPPVNRLAITDGGAYLWNNAPVSAIQLGALLAATKTDPRQPILHIQTSPSARYDRFDHTLAMVKRAGIEKIGFVGNAAGF